MQMNEPIIQSYRLLYYISAHVPNAETLNFNRKKEMDEISSLILSSAKNSDATNGFVKEKGTAKSEKRARFGETEDIITHEYVETEAEKKAKSRIVSKTLNAQEETEKVENECKQS